MQLDNIGQIANDLIPTADVVIRVAHWLCILVGFCLLATAVSFYKAHRFNPKFMPLERPIIIAFLGIVLIVLPFFKQIFLPSDFKPVTPTTDQTLLENDHELM
jgi:hypothetical protein